jgi:hypothetical protein
VHNLFLACLFLFRTSFGRLCAHHQEKLLSICDNWYFSLCVDDCMVCVPDSHPQTVTNTKCRKDKVISPDDGHTVARNLYGKEINIVRKIVHQVDFTYKIIQGCTVNRTQNSTNYQLYLQDHTGMQGQQNAKFDKLPTLFTRSYRDARSTERKIR